MSDISLLKQESITAVGIWKKSHSVVPYHSGATFHRLAEVKRHKILAISTEETIFALLRTNFILIDRESDQILLAKDIFKRIEDSNDTETLLRVHVYLSLQRIGKFPISDNIIVATPADIDIEEYIKRFKCTKHEKIELHQLLDAFKTYYESSTLRLNGRYSSVECIWCYITGH
ncbi:hypothetical protein BEWA_027910 [Theileria equi strain WA]|uniref:Uncharacterized protein n=1 Tax=Theileria equi strain WA TaxID=1537102 RepID=L0AWH8_THEEQ|nr:hypothetical protein BEWA_027910 [Theileria equi strain WA]AFZ79942.1 hypothetical protein BEWA_027910 [Theileria equi strain WA]|eukprot:XP_004829608.1 hypothetical protein BEWA_027910 [Theileria equi strain WA]